MRVVVAVTIAVAAGPLLVLAFAYPLLRRVCLGIARRAVHSPRRLAAFAFVLFAVPVALIAV